jgi:hypothetical protein
MAPHSRRNAGSGRVVPAVGPEVVNTVVLHLLRSFKKLPGFDAARVADIKPIYDLDGTRVSYHEVKLSSPRMTDNGLVIVSASHEELPIPWPRWRGFS